MRKYKFEPISTYGNSYLAQTLGEISKTTEMDYSLLSLSMISLVLFRQASVLSALLNVCNMVLVSTVSFRVVQFNIR